MHFSTSSCALVATTFTAIVTASPVALRSNAKPSFWGLEDTHLAADDVIKHLENTGAIKWTPAPGGGSTVAIESDTWALGVQGAMNTNTTKRDATSQFMTRDTSTGLIDGLAGSVNCYGSGSSDFDGTIQTFVSQACTALVNLLVPPSGKAVAKGAYQLWKSGQTTNTDNNLSYIKFGAKFLTSSWTAVDTTLCQDAYEVWSNYCQNKDSASTKGGILSLGDVIEFVADPTVD